MSMIGKKIYIHEETYHDGETGVIVSDKNEHGQYEVTLDVGGNAYVRDGEYEVIRENAGYTIVTALRIDSTHEIVIGHRPTAPAPYVCWDCRNGDDYNTGGYCETYRQVLLILSERIRNRYDYLPFEI